MIQAALLLSAIHLRRYLRMLNQLGIFRVIILGIILFFALKASLRPGMLLWQSMAIIAILAMAHLARKDFILLNNSGLNNPLFFILLYLFILSPFLCLYIWWPDYKAAGLLVAGIALVSLVRKPIRLTRRKIYPSFRFITADAWEWRAGLRKNYLLLAAVLLIVSLFHEYDYLFAAAVLVCSIVTASFLMVHEPRPMLVSLGKPAVSLLRRKILLQTGLFSLLVLPLLISSVLLFPDGYRPVMLVFFTSLIVQAFAVSVKYSGYLPGAQTPYHMILIVLLNFTFILPVLLPLPVIMLAVFSAKAIHQLKPVTDDSSK